MVACEYELYCLSLYKVGLVDTDAGWALDLSSSHTQLLCNLFMIQIHIDFKGRKGVSANCQ